MAQIVLSANELVKLMSAFAIDSGRVSEVKAEQSKIKFKIQTPGILPSVTVSIEFEEYVQGQAVFALEANPLVKLAIEMFDMPGMNWLKITSSQITVDVNALVQQKMPNMRVVNIQQPSPGQFLIEMQID